MEEFGAVKTILRVLEVIGISIEVSARPRLASATMRELAKRLEPRGEFNEKDKKKFYNTFYYLRKKGLIDIRHQRRQIYISLTDEGKKKAGRYKIDDLKIEEPKKWDGKWRVLVFDIEDKHKIKREALRGKLKELGFYQMQKSVWVCPYEFKKEIVILRDFFGLTDGEMKIIDAERIENDSLIRQFHGFK